MENEIQQNEQIQVSVCCLVYNHEKYLRQCLDGFVMQKGVTFEVLIHDDASTDHSADIIREYEAKYPEIIKPIYQKENQHSKHIPISQTYLYPPAKGKYIALCEGDDYWTDPLKLKKQFDALESHPECHICVCKVIGIDCTTGREVRSFPEDNYSGLVIPPEELMYKLQSYPFQTSSFFLKRKDLLEYSDNSLLFRRLSDVGDEPLLLFFCSKGAFCYINEPMSCYRMNVPNSFCSKWKDDFDMSVAHKKKKVDMLEAYNTYTNGYFLPYGLEKRIAVAKLDYSSTIGAHKLSNEIVNRYKQYFSKKTRLLFRLQLLFPNLISLYLRLKHGKQK